jgi:DnaJ-class molecular chaperone
MTADPYPGWSPNSHHPPGRDKEDSYWKKYHEYKYEYRRERKGNPFEEWFRDDDPFLGEAESHPNLNQNAWSILGIKETNDESIIRKAYYRLAREYHPDKGGDPAEMVRLNNAYEWAMRFV